VGAAVGSLVVGAGDRVVEFVVGARVRVEFVVVGAGVGETVMFAVFVGAAVGSLVVVVGAGDRVVEFVVEFVVGARV
jgi:hypothetical protein